MQLGSVGLAVDTPTVGWSLGPWPTARGQPLTEGPRIPLDLCSEQNTPLCQFLLDWHRCHRYGTGAIIMASANFPPKV